MPNQQTMPRMLADEMYDTATQVSVDRIVKAKFSPEEFERMADAAREIEAIPFMIDDTAQATVGSILAKSQAVRKKFERAGRRLDLVVIDYLKFVHASDRYAGQRHYEVGEITAALKQIARNMNTVVILCAQLNRKVEDRSDHRPQLADLRESGDIEADSDVVILLFREAYYLERDPELNTDPDKIRRLETVTHLVEFIVAKNRMGPTCTIPSFINLEHSAVRDLTKQGDLDLRGPS